MGKESIKMIANNKKARHDYFLEELYEAGIDVYKRQDFRWFWSE